MRDNGYLSGDIMRIDSNFIYVLLVILFIILISIQYTLNKILIVLKEIKDIFCGKKNRD